MKYHRVLEDIPKDVLGQLTSSRAILGNAGNPTKQPKHDTILVHPDPILGYALNPNTRIYANMLKTKQPFNLDPPVLHQLQPLEKLPPRIQEYINRESRLAYSYGIGDDGRRNTLPQVTAEKKILVIGDSVAFGVGLNDEQTIPSQLQQLIGDQYQVVNAGVGGYSGQQAFEMANKLSRQQHFDGLIYIACQNDFMGANGEMEDVLIKLQSISDRFDNRIIVILHTYLEYNARHILLGGGWNGTKINKTSSLRQKTPIVARRMGFAYADWTNIVDQFRQREGSIFSPFALYVDHCHLSHRGSRLMAAKLSALIREHWLSIMPVHSHLPNPATFNTSFSSE
jgi:lysophospholipase L1-like esterase